MAPIIIVLAAKNMLASNKLSLADIWRAWVEPEGLHYDILLLSEGENLKKIGGWDRAENFSI